MSGALELLLLGPKWGPTEISGPSSWGPLHLGLYRTQAGAHVPGPCLSTQLPKGKSVSFLSSSCSSLKSGVLTLVFHGFCDDEAIFIKYLADQHVQQAKRIAVRIFIFNLGLHFRAIH